MIRRWSELLMLVGLSVLIAVSSSEDVKEKKSKEQVKFGNHQNIITKGMFDDELYQSKKSDQSVENDQDLEDTKDSSEEEDERKDKLDEMESNTILDNGRDDDDNNDDSDMNDELSRYRDSMTSIPYSSQKYRPYGLNLNKGAWNNYDRYYYYDQESDDPSVFRKKRNMDITRPANALKRTPRKRAPLHTPLEELMRSRNGLKRSVRVKRDMSPYYQEKLAELLAEIAERKAREESDKEKYLRFRERFMGPLKLGYNQESRNELANLLDVYPYKLPPYITKQLKEDLSMSNSPGDMDSGEDDLIRDDSDTTSMDNSPDESDMPTFFRRPYQRRSDYTFYPAPNAYQWLVSGQKRSPFNTGRWGPIDDKRREDDIDEIDPAKLYLFASLLDGDDDIGLERSTRPRKRLIL